MADRRTTPEKPRATPRRGRGAAAAKPKRARGAVPVAAAAGASAPPDVGALERRVRELDAMLGAERARHARQLAAVRRASDRKLAAMVNEIVALRHHEARADMLARLLAEREAPGVSPASGESDIDGQASRPVGG